MTTLRNKPSVTIIDVNIVVTGKVRKTWTATLTCGERKLELKGTGKQCIKPALLAVKDAVKAKDAFLRVHHNVPEFQEWMRKTRNSTQTLKTMTGLPIFVALAK